MNRNGIQRGEEKPDEQEEREEDESNWRDKESKGMEQRGETDNQREIRLIGREERVRL